MNKTTVAIIGNAPNLLNSHLGSKIDSHDIVIRINRFHTKNFEEDVGQKTDIWCRNELTSYKRTGELWQEELKNLQEIFIVAPLHILNKRRKQLEAYWKSQYKDYKVNFILNQEIEEITNEIEWPKKKFPSSGIMCIHHFIEKYGHVSIAGFDFFTSYDGSPRHYFNNQEKVTDAFIWHSPEREKMFVEKKQQEGKLTFIQELNESNANSKNFDHFINKKMKFCRNHLKDIISTNFMLTSDGKISGHENKNEKHWKINEDELLILDSEGKISCNMKKDKINGKDVLVGNFYDTSTKHILSLPN